MCYVFFGAGIISIYYLKLKAPNNLQERSRSSYSNSQFDNV